LFEHIILREAPGTPRTAGNNKPPPQQQQMENNASVFQKPVRREPRVYATVQKVATTVAGNTPASPNAPKDTLNIVTM
jgi:hypothetical protein